MRRFSLALVYCSFAFAFFHSNSWSSERPNIYGAGIFWVDWLAPEAIPERFRSNPRAYNQAQMDLIVAMGGTMVHGSFDWLAIEPVRGVYDWAAADERVADSLARGLTVYAYIGNTPDWALPPGGLPGFRTPPDEAYRADFEAYCTAVAARYAGQVDHFFFWNEPNGCSWVNDGCNNSNGYPLYTHWLKIAHTALKAGNPNCKVAAGVLDYQSGLSAWNYLEGMYREGARGHFDAIAIHPYAFGGGIHWAAITDTRQVMLNYLDGDKEIWINEYGWPNSSDGYAPDWLRDFLGRIKQPEFHYITMCRYLVMSDLEDGKYGLCNRELTPRPIYHAFRDFDKSFPPTYTPTATHAVRFPTPPPPGTNLVFNGDASQGLSGWQVRRSTNPNIPPTDLVAHSGFFEVDTIYREVALFQYQTVEVRPGGTYEAGFEGIQTDGSHQYLDLIWYDGEALPGFNPILQDGYGALEGLHTGAVYTNVTSMPYDQNIPGWTSYHGGPFKPTMDRVTIALFYRHVHATNRSTWRVRNIYLREVQGTSPIPTPTPGGVVAGNLLSNPGAEAGTLNGWGVGGPNLPVINLAVDVPSPPNRSGSNRFSWSSVPAGKGFLYQTVPTTPGRRYRIGLSVAQQDGSDEYLDVYFTHGNVQTGWNRLFTLDAVRRPNWVSFEDHVDAIGNQMTLALFFRHNWPTGRATFHVDDIYIVDVEAPPPTNTPTPTPPGRAAGFQLR